MISIDIINKTKILAVLHAIDARKAFDLVINDIALLALRSLGFPEAVTMMIGKLWSGRICRVKTSYRVSSGSYRSTLAELLYGLGQGSTYVTVTWGVLHGPIMHVVVIAFVGALFLSVSGLPRHENIGEGFKDDTGVGTTNPDSTAITPNSQKELTSEELTLHMKANIIL
jgi:hypothetical protein